MTTPQALADEAKRKLTAALNAAGGHIAGFRLMTEIVGLLDSLAALAATPPQTSVQGASPSGTALSAAIPNADPLGLVREADDLLGVARGAAMKLGLRDRGSDCRLPHEVRMFALDFSNEGRDGPGALQVRGTGRFLAWRRKARGIEADARRAGAESPVPPGTRPDPQSQPVAAHPESITEMMDAIIETSEGIGRAGPATDLVLTLRQKRREAYHRITRACGVVVFDGPDAFAEADAATARLDAEIEAAGGLEAWRPAASKEVAAQQPLTPDMFWDDDDPEMAHESIRDVVNDAWSCGTVTIGTEMTIQQAMRLPNIKVRVVDDGDGGFDYEVIELCAGIGTQAQQEPTND